MLKRIQSLPDWARTLIFSLLVVGMALLFIVIFLLLTLQSFGSVQRLQAIPSMEGISVEEFATLPDEDAYPAAVAVSSDGILYTGSYQTGVVWAITPDGEITEIADTREKIGSLTGIEVARDGTVWLLDRISALEAKGAIIWKWTPESGLETFSMFVGAQPSGGFDDIALDSVGRIYVSDRSQKQIWRIEPDGAQSIWWRSPETPAEPTGLAYSATTDTLLITDPTQNKIYRVATGAEDTISATELLYSTEDGRAFPAFDGITVAPDGTIYVAALGINRVARLDQYELVYLAENFRGVSDVAFDAPRKRLYVTNWNQFSLLSNTRPQLPFALDMIIFAPVE